MKNVETPPKTNLVKTNSGSNYSFSWEIVPEMKLAKSIDLWLIKKDEEQRKYFYAKAIVPSLIFKTRGGFFMAKRSLVQIQLA